MEIISKQSRDFYFAAGYVGVSQFGMNIPPMLLVYFARA